MRRLLLTNTFQLFFLSLYVFVVSGSSKVTYEDERNQQSDSDCVTPHGEPGRCIQYTACSPINSITQWDRVLPHICGFTGDEPLVCCPLNNNNPLRRKRTSSLLAPRGTERPKRSVDKSPRCGITNHDAALVRHILPSEQTEPGAWPWMAVVFWQRSYRPPTHVCGGTLVTDRLVLTAAHCVATREGNTPMDPALLSVRLGAHNLRIQNETGSVQVAVDAVRIHEQFDPQTFKNDIALLRLSRPVNFTDRIQPVCLPYDVDFSQDTLTDKIAYVAGYAIPQSRTRGYISGVLLQATFIIPSQDYCVSHEKELQFNITKEYLCALMANDLEDACQAEIGVPLVTKDSGEEYYLIGITTFGKSCDFPIYFTRVTEYLDWLTTNIAELESNAVQSQTHAKSFKNG